MTSPAPQACFQHADRGTYLACSRCGRPACPECLRPAPVGQHCVHCVAEHQSSQRRATNQRRAQRPAGQIRPNPMAAPVVTYVLLALNVVLYLLAAAGSSFNNTDSGRLTLDWGLFPPAVQYHHEYYRLLTAGFIHFSMLHIALNMITLYILGRDVEAIFGSLRYAAIYLVSLLGGSAVVMLFAAPNSLTAGASGAIYGLLGAVVVVVLRTKQPLGQIVAVLVINVAFTVAIPGISLWGHLGGFLFGVATAAAFVYLPLLLPNIARTARNVGLVSWGAAALLAVAAVAIGVTA